MSEWRPNSRPQEEFMKSSVDELLYGGAAGGGKSEVLMIEGLRDMGNPNAQSIYFRRTFPELERSAIPRSKKIFPAFGATYNGSKHYWKFPSGALYWFGHMSNDDTTLQYQSAEFTYIAFDELTHFTYYQYKYLISRLRKSSPELNTYIRSATNPGGPGHTWVRYYFRPDIDPYKIRHYEKRVNYENNSEYFVEVPAPTGNSLSRQFIPAKVYDNPAIMENDPGYVARLKSLPPDERKMLLEGDWNVFKGQFFKQFSPLVHGRKPFMLRRDEWEIFGGLDYGESAPTSFGLYAVRKHPYKIIRVGGYYRADITASEHAKNIIQFCNNCHYTHGEVPKVIYADPSMFTKRRMDEANSYSPADIFSAHGLNLIKANNARVPGWQVCKDILNPNLAKEPIFSYFIGENDDFVRTVPGLIHDKTNPEDLDTTAEDHCADDWRYAMAAVVNEGGDQPKRKTWRDMLREKIMNAGNNNSGSFMGA